MLVLSTKLSPYQLCEKQVTKVMHFGLLTYVPEPQTNNIRIMFLHTVLSITPFAVSFLLSVSKLCKYYVINATASGR